MTLQLGWLFNGRSQRSLLWTSEDPQHVCTREGGLDSMGAVEGLSSMQGHCSADNRVEAIGPCC